MSSPDIVILSSIDWDFVWQRHQTFAALLSRRAQVFFIENTGFRAPRWGDAPRLIGRLRRWGTRGPASLKNPVPENVVILSPLVFPPGPGLNHWLNDRVFIPALMRRLRAHGVQTGPILWTYLPTRTTLSVIRHLRPTAVIYDCAVNFHGHPEAPPDLDEIEQRLLAVTDLILADSPFLFQRYRRTPRPVFQLHHGVDVELFVQANQPDTYPRTLGYFGSIHHHLDWEAIRALASAGFEVKLIGPLVGNPPPRLPPTVKFRPPVSPQELIREIAQCAALLLPYHVHTAYMQGVLPAKIYECLATGKPVLSSPLPSFNDELREVLCLCAAPSDFVRAAESLAVLNGNPRAERQLALARQHSHEATARRLDDILSVVTRR
jgi:glycosyltransferase involved in cell wall biosynthesis